MYAPFALRRLERSSCTMLGTILASVLSSLLPELEQGALWAKSGQISLVFKGLTELTFPRETYPIAASADFLERQDLKEPHASGL
jgi:hypothetical protein